MFASVFEVMAYTVGLFVWFFVVMTIVLRGKSDGPHCPGRWGQQGTLCPYCHARVRKGKARKPHG